MFANWKKTPNLVVGYNVRSFTDVRNGEPITLNPRPWVLVKDRTFKLQPWYYPSALQFNTALTWFLRWPLGLGIRWKKLAFFVGFEKKGEGYVLTAQKAFGQSSKPDLVSTLPSFREGAARSKGEARDLRAIQSRRFVSAAQGDRRVAPVVVHAGRSQSLTGNSSKGA